METTDVVFLFGAIFGLGIGMSLTTVWIYTRKRKADNRG